MRLVDDLSVYKRLIALVDELNELAEQCASVMTETALRACARLVRRVASAVWKRVET